MLHRRSRRAARSHWAHPSTTSADGLQHQQRGWSSKDDESEPDYDGAHKEQHRDEADSEEEAGAMWGDAGGASRIFTDEDADWAEQGGWVSESESQDSEDLDLDAVLAAVGLGRRRAVLVQIGVCSLGGVGGATPDQLLDAGGAR